MATYDWFADTGVIPKTAEIYPEPNDRATTSPYSFSAQTGGFPSVRWRFVWHLPPLSGDKLADVNWFLDRLNGREHQIKARVYGRRNRGTYGGTPKVKGGSQTGKSITIDGCTASVTDWGRQGDCLNIGDELHVLAADADTDGSGEVSLSLCWPVREAPADNADIEVTNPYAIMILEGRRVPRAFRPGILMQASVTMVEPLR